MNYITYILTVLINFSDNGIKYMGVLQSFSETCEQFFFVLKIHFNDWFRQFF